MSLVFINLKVNFEWSNIFKKGRILTYPIFSNIIFHKILSRRRTSHKVLFVILIVVYFLIPKYLFLIYCNMIRN